MGSNTKYRILFVSADLESSFIGMLLGDVDIAIERHQHVNSQAEKRNLVRTSFAAVEGLAWIFREHIIEVANTTGGLEPDELQAFSEMSYGVSEQGRIYSQPRFISLLPMIRLIARTAERIRPGATIDFSGADWDRFRSAIAIRNRITHPKSKADLTLSEDDIAASLGALFWFLEQIAAVMAATNVAARDYVGQLDEVLQLLRSGDQATTALYNALLRNDAS